jgi:hypothetical protein
MGDQRAVINSTAVLPRRAIGGLAVSQLVGRSREIGCSRNSRTSTARFAALDAGISARQVLRPQEVRAWLFRNGHGRS